MGEAFSLQMFVNIDNICPYQLLVQNSILSKLCLTMPYNVIGKME